METGDKEREKIQVHMISLEPLDPTMSQANSTQGIFNYEKKNDTGMWGGVHMCAYVFCYFIILLKALGAGSLLLETTISSHSVIKLPYSLIEPRSPDISTHCQKPEHQE